MASNTAPGAHNKRQQNRGLVSSFFRKRTAGQSPPQATFAASSDSTTYSGSAAHRSHAANAAPPNGGGRWQITAGKKAAQAGGGGNAGHQTREALLQELEFFRGECARQTRDLEELCVELQSREAEGDALRQALNLERFKYELLVDLWAMRVLDNEELGMQNEAAAQAAHHLPGE